MFIVGVATSALIGVSTPLSLLFFSDLVNEFASPTLSSFVVVIQRMAILGAVTFIVAYIQMFCLQFCARRQTKRIRHLFFSSVLRQDAAWFDVANVGAMITRLTEGVDKVEAGVGEKVGLFVQNLFVFIGGVIISLVKNWELALVSAAFFPLVAASFAAVGFVVRKLSAKERAAYSRANGIAGEVLGAVKTIFAFEGQVRETKRYSGELSEAEKVGLKRSTIVGFVLGTTDASIYVLMAVTFYYGIVMLGRGASDPGEIILVVLAMLFAGATVGQAFQQFDYFNFAVTAAGEIFPIIDRIPPIDKRPNDEKVRLSSVRCDIVFEDVSFSYPTRPDVLVLDHFSWHLRPGQNLAIVGASGSGKSTLVQLLQRLYDPDYGRITIDGVDLRDLDLAWWRSCIGVVSQEPTLFAGSLMENIRLGKPNASVEDVEAAARLAHAHEFTSKLPEAYETVFVAQDGGGGMSDQKQRGDITREACSEKQNSFAKFVSVAHCALMHTVANSIMTFEFIEKALSSCRSFEEVLLCYQFWLLQPRLHNVLRGQHREGIRGGESDSDSELSNLFFTGNIVFNIIRFHYPMRKQVCPQGLYVQGALVGQSGCGKSTALLPVQRIFDPTNTDFTEGILFDGINACTLAPNWIRRQIGVVSQEPNPLDLTIRENIAYGLNYRFENPEDVTVGVPMEAIIEAARQANAYEFISSLPEQYETRVGARGSRLSGGQKQRIAIARALVRDPRLLVLDEATAALDNESERVVQAALDEAMKKGGRTCLVVAHRL